MSAQRVLAAVSDAWRDRRTLETWLARLPAGSEVIYRRRGDDAIGEIVGGAGLVPLPREEDPDELARVERLDAVLVFAAGSLLSELLVVVAAHKRGLRSTVVPPSAPSRRSRAHREEL